MLYRELGIRTARRSRAAAADGRIRALRGHGREEGSADPQGARRAEASRRPASAARRARRRRGARRAACASTRRTAHDRRRSAACAAAARPAATSTSSPPARRPSLMDAFTEYRLVERVLAHGDTKSSVLLQGGFQADLRLVAGRQPRRRAAVLHRLEGAQHRAARSRDRPGLQAERVRPVPRRGRRAASPARPRKTSTRRSACSGSRRSCARIAARSRRPRRRAAAPSDRSRRPARRSPHAHHRDRRQGRHRRRWPRRRATAGLEYIAITDHSKALAMANGLDERRALAHAARIRALDGQRRASGCWPASSATSGRRHARSGRRLPRRARPRRRVGPLGVQPGPAADDRPAAARDREPARRHPRPSDRPADSHGASPIPSTSRRSSTRRRATASRSRSTARSIGSI